MWNIVQLFTILWVKYWKATNLSSGIWYPIGILQLMNK